MQARGSCVTPLLSLGTACQRAHLHLALATSCVFLGRPVFTLALSTLLCVSLTDKSRAVLRLSCACSGYGGYSGGYGDARGYGGSSGYGPERGGSRGYGAPRSAPYDRR